MSFHWTCPYCDRDTTITDTQAMGHFELMLDNSEGYRYFTTSLIVCPNVKCRRFTLTMTMYDYISKKDTYDRRGLQSANPSRAGI